LPEIIRLTKKRGIRLILVRTKRLSDPTPAHESPPLRRYISDLYAYLEDNHVDYLDLAHDERIKPEYFFDSLHLNAEGKEVFTRLLAGDLMPILKKP
jgi:lysophospholipase L1-like esterase